jgi:hypothetical protein
MAAGSRIPSRRGNKSKETETLLTQFDDHLSRRNATFPSWSARIRRLGILRFGPRIGYPLDPHWNGGVGVREAGGDGAQELAKSDQLEIPTSPRTAGREEKRAEGQNLKIVRSSDRTHRGPDSEFFCTKRNVKRRTEEGRGVEPSPERRDARAWRNGRRRMVDEEVEADIGGKRYSNQPIEKYCDTQK